MRWPDHIEVVDVALRDGLQSLDRIYSTEIKLQIAGLLVDAGLRRLEVTSFVRPDVVPQLADAEELLRRLPRDRGCTYRALVPNLRGMERAVEVGVDQVLVLATASDTYGIKNQGMSIDDSLVQVQRCVALADAHHISSVIGISNALFCPYEGAVPRGRLLQIVESVVSAGATEVYLGVSAGVDPPREVHDRVAAIVTRWPQLRVGVHLHNTNGMALANALAAADAGATFVEGSVCGLGGGIRMPGWLQHYGNVATEDLVHMFNASAVATGIDLDKLVAVASETAKLLELELVSSSALAGGTRRAVLSGGDEAPVQAQGAQ